MNKNMSTMDRVIRLVIAVVVGVLFYLEILTGTLAYVLLSLSAIFVLTSFAGWCGLYTLLGISTCKTKA